VAAPVKYHSAALDISSSTFPTLVPYMHATTYNIYLLLPSSPNVCNLHNTLICISNPCYSHNNNNKVSQDYNIDDNIIHTHHNINNIINHLHQAIDVGGNVHVNNTSDLLDSIFHDIFTNGVRGNTPGSPCLISYVEFLVVPILYTLNNSNDSTNNTKQYNNNNLLHTPPKAGRKCRSELSVTEAQPYRTEGTTVLLSSHTNSTTSNISKDNKITLTC